MRAQAEKASAFRALHDREGAFLIPNPWDAGSAKLLERLGFEALATTSGGHAFSLGRADNTASRDEALSHVRFLASATSIPLSADLENGYGDDPETVAETIRRVAAEGAVGCSIEDFTRRREDPIYPPPLSVDRIRAAADAARSLPFPFLLTAPR